MSRNRPFESSLSLGNNQRWSDPKTASFRLLPTTSQSGSSELQTPMEAPHKNHLGSAISPSEREPSAQQLTPSGSSELQTPTEAPHKNHLESAIYYVPKFFFVCVALVVSYYFQITGDPPLKVHTYWTDDPQDNGQLRGYTCGCDLPASMQNVDYEKRKSAESGSAGFNLNVCYDPSALQDMNIIMFSNSSAEQVEFIIRESVDATRMSPGYMVEQQAHAIDGPLDSTVDNGPRGIGIQHLYPAGVKQNDIGSPISYLTGWRFQSFPSDFLRLAFTYCGPLNCSDQEISTSCSVKRVNQIFDDVFTNVAEKWGGCFLVNVNECDQASFSYQAMCTIYPTTTIPTVFGLKSFLKLIQNTTNKEIVQNITAPNPWGFFWNNGSTLEVSLQPSIVYVNHSKVTPSQVLLRFKQVDRQSAQWLDLAGFFPSLDSSCSSLSNATVCTGGSICSSYMNAGSLNVLCLNQSILSKASYCERVFDQSTLQNAEHLCEDLNITPTSPENSQCACMDQACQPIPPYLATWNTSKYLDSDPLNAFLYSRYLKNDWARRSGVCTNNHAKVIPYNPGDEFIAPTVKLGAQTILLQGECLPKRCFNGAFNWTESCGYLHCWLTGKYRNFTDLDDEDWKPLHPIPQFRNFSNSDTEGRFVCYKINRERTFDWFIVVFGVVFGWAGSVDLIFHFLKWFKDIICGRVEAKKECIQYEMKKAEATTVESSL